MSTAETPLVRVYHANKSQGSFIHGEHKLVPGGFCDVPRAVADAWLSHTGYGGALVTEREEEVTPRVAAIEKENANLLADKKTQLERIANLEKMIAELKAASTGTKIPVVEDQKPGEVAPSQNVVTGDELAAAQTAKASRKRS